VDPFRKLVEGLNREFVRYVVIGVWGANYYAHAGAVSFRTKDRDLFLPLDPENLIRAWRACVTAELELWSNREPLDQPRDRFLADRVVAQRALVHATDGRGLEVDLTLVMAGFDFETVWKEHRTFNVEGVDVPVARLLHIVTSKQAAGRDKDKLFLATHKQALADLLKRPE
jgi:hypothetical protein